MLRQSIILLGVVCLILLGHCNVGAAEVPSPDKTYVIQSSMDGGIIRPSGGGELCKGLAVIIPIYRLDAPYSDLYKWNISMSSITGRSTLHTFVPGTGASINELTYDEYPPYCYLVYRELAFIPNTSGDGSFMIQAVRTDQCLTSWGSEVGVLFWHTCGDVGQHWYFLEA